jgi:hypothetical protein
MPHTIAEMRALAEQWIAAWNARDLGRIMDHYAADVEFEANTVVRRCRKPTANSSASLSSASISSLAWNLFLTCISSWRICSRRQAATPYCIAARMAIAYWTWSSLMIKERRGA